jgi:PAS domain S-box-containing protein
MDKIALTNSIAHSPAEAQSRNGQEQQQEADLRVAQANLVRYQELFDFAPDGYLVTDLQAVIQLANHAASAMLGTRKEFLPGKPLLFFVAKPDQRFFADKLYLLTSQAENRLQWEAMIDPPRGSRISVLVTAASAPVLEEPTTIHWMLRDITRRKKAEETLHRERDFADGLIEMAEAVILVVDAGGRLVRTNPYLRTLTGARVGELEDQLLTDLAVAEDRPSVCVLLDRFASGERRVRGVHRLRSGREGRTRTVAWSGRLIGGPGGESLILIVGNDVTELQEAQQRALQAERLAAIGQMAAGLAHESRNALQRIQACLALLGFRLAGQSENLELLARAQKAQDDLRRLYDDVREYAAPIQLDLRCCRLDEVWRQAWEDIAPLREGKDAVLVEEQTGGVDLECLASPFHLEQVFRNLFENALAAASSNPSPVGRGGPRITVRCTAVQLDGREAIQVAVQDNGPGFAEEERKRAFEVFFTTKVRGMGLGLAICKRIIEAHGGRIEVGDSPEPGALLLITLPRRST